MMETNKPLEIQDGDWKPISISSYTFIRLMYEKTNTKTLTGNIQSSHFRLVRAYGDLIEKLYNTRILNLKDIANLIGEMPDDVRVRKHNEKGN